MNYITPCDHETQRREVHPSQRQHHVTPCVAPLYVITTITNPQRFYSRYRLYQRFEKMVEDAGGILYTIEMALRDRFHECTSPTNPRHIQLRSPVELWHKENLINIGVRHLPADWRYVAWIDADIEFARPDWVVETVHQLQHYKIIQMWSHAQDLGPDPHSPGNLWCPNGQVFQSFLYSWVTGRPIKNAWKCYPSGHGQGHLWHSGYAWAARRSALSDLGGLGDIAILGSGDHHMAGALVGHVGETIHRDMLPNYRAYWKRWEDRAIKYIDFNVGYMPGLIYHHWHGKKSGRNYMERWKILTQNRYDWERDVKYDVQGLLQFTENNWRLRNQVREYFRFRNEDGVDL